MANVLLTAEQATLLNTLLNDALHTSAGRLPCQEYGFLGDAFIYIIVHGDVDDATIVEEGGAWDEGPGRDGGRRRERAGRIEVLEGGDGVVEDGG